MMKNVVTGILATVVALVLLPAGALAEEAAKADDAWQFGASIYGWFPDIAGETTGGGGIQVDIDQILENLEFTFMGTFEARKGNWGVLTDIIYMDVSGNAPIGGGDSASLDLESWIWNLVGSYRVLDEPAFVMDVLAGGRYLDVAQELTWTGPGPGGSATVELSNWDAIVGVRGRVAVGRKHAIFIPYELDVGAGDSDLTLQAASGLGYSFGWWEVVGVWRYLYYDLPSKVGINDMSFSGPALGVVFRW